MKSSRGSSQVSSKDKAAAAVESEKVEAQLGE